MVRGRWGPKCDPFFGPQNTPQGIFTPLGKMVSTAPIHYLRGVCEPKLSLTIRSHRKRRLVKRRLWGVRIRRPRTPEDGAPNLGFKAKHVEKGYHFPMHVTYMVADWSLHGFFAVIQGVRARVVREESRTGTGFQGRTGNRKEEGGESPEEETRFGKIYFLGHSYNP